MKIKCYSLFPVIFFTITLVVFIDAFHPASGKSADQPLVSLEIVDETLEETLHKVSKISGYTIDIQPQWRDLSITVLLVNVPLEEAILRILSNRINHAIVWNDKEKKIAITIMGSSIKTKEYGIFKKLQNRLSGQNTRFEQMSKTTEY
jgi:hypothetical protein